MKRFWNKKMKKFLLYLCPILIVLLTSIFLFRKVNIINDFAYMQPIPTDLLISPELDLGDSGVVEYTGNAVPSKHGKAVVAPIKKEQFAKKTSKFVINDKIQIKNEKLKTNIAEAEKIFGTQTLNVQDGVITLKKLDDKGSVINAVNFDARTGEKIDLRDVFADNVDALYEINKKISYYLLTSSAGNFRYAKFLGVSANTSFYITENKELILFFNSATPVLSGKTLTFNLNSFGNNGDIIAYYNRFPMFNSYAELRTEAKITSDEVQEKTVYYKFGQKKNPWVFYEKYKPVGYMPLYEDEIIDYDERYYYADFSGTKEALLKIPLSEYVLDNKGNVVCDFVVAGEYDFYVHGLEIYERIIGLGAGE